jgi:hypothetical protein
MFSIFVDILFPSLGSKVTLFAALKPEQNASEEVSSNRGMLERAVYALERHSPKLRFIAFPSGTRVSTSHVSSSQQADIFIGLRYIQSRWCLQSTARRVNGPSTIIVRRWEAPLRCSSRATGGKERRQTVDLV